MDTDLQRLVGQRIAARRQRAHLTQLQLAAKVGVHETTINRMERGHIVLSMDTLRAIAVATHTSADYLLGLSDTPSPPRSRRKQVPIGV